MTVVTLATALLLHGTPAPDINTMVQPSLPETAQTIEITASPPADIAVPIYLPQNLSPTGGVIAPISLDITPAAFAPPAEAPASDGSELTAEGDAPPVDEIIVTGDTRISHIDPLAEVNIASYEAVQAVDQALVAPIAKGYESAIPEPIRDGLGNALRNVAEPVNFLNFLLQLKIGKAVETAARFAINSTLGVAGLFDVAKKKPFKLPHRRNGFANTLGFYGVKPGPYFYLPLIGSTTLRDLAGNSLDLMLVPTVVGRPFNRAAYSIPANVVMQLNARIERDEEIQRLQKESPNPYAETRTLYLQMRQNEIDALKNKPKPAPEAALDAAPELPFVPVPEAGPAPSPAPVATSGPTLAAEPAPEITSAPDAPDAPEPTEAVELHPLGNPAPTPQPIPSQPQK